MTRPLTPEELTQLFQTIEGEPTGKLSELAKVAGLNLAEDYIGADLSGENLSGDNLSNANLSGANLRNANLRESNLSDAILSSANLHDADLRNANLSNADLSNANLNSANLSGANLFNANLDNTNLSNANLSHVNFRSASLLRAKNLTTANLVDTILITANLGLSQKEMLGLKQRGAIIEDITSVIVYNSTLDDLSRIELFIICALYGKKELDGLAIIQDHLASASLIDLEVKFGSLYPDLAKLEKKGLVKSFWGDERLEIRRGARRKYYTLTYEGERIFNEFVKMYPTILGYLSNKVFRK